MTDITYKANTRILKKILTVLLDAGLVPYIISSPGMGKSAIIKALSRDYNLELIDHRITSFEPVDFNGLPRITDNYAKMVPFADVFPLTTTPVPEGKNGWILFLDEFSNATKQTQAAAYRPVLDHQVGQYDLHPDCRIILAGNKVTDKAAATGTMSTALQSRVVYIELELNFNIWFEDVAIAENYHPMVTAFLMNNQTRLHDFDPDRAGKPFCCPRTWEFMNRQIQVTDGPVDYMYPAYTGTITSGVAVEFVQFCKVFNQLTSKDQVLKNPATAVIPTDQSTKWALLSSAISWIDESNFAALCTFANRFEMSMRVFFYRAAMVSHPTLRSTPEYGAAAAQISHLL